MWSYYSENSLKYNSILTISHAIGGNSNPRVPSLPKMNNTDPNLIDNANIVRPSTLSHTFGDQYWCRQEGILTNIQRQRSSFVQLTLRQLFRSATSISVSLLIWSTISEMCLGYDFEAPSGVGTSNGCAAWAQYKRRCTLEDIIMIT